MVAQSKYVSKAPDSKGYIAYDPEEQETWKILITRQKKIVENRACDEFLEGLKILGMNEKEIPQHEEVSSAMRRCTGWSVKQVAAIIPAEEFFTLLANKQFPAASFIRTRQELDYLQEPDIFHEMFGHCPLLTRQEYADFMMEYGKLALKVSGKDRMLLFRLFWFTIEFGLIRTPVGLRIYGGGILSSKNETIYSLEDPKALRVDFDPMVALRTPYRINIMQPLYFVIQNLNELYKILDGDVLKKLEESKRLGDFAPLFEVEKKVQNGKTGPY